MLLRLVLAAALAAALLAGCGDPAGLDRGDATKLAAAREGLDDALDTEETLRTSKAEARRLAAQVRRLVAQGRDVERIEKVVPSLVVRRDGKPSLDTRAVNAFLRHASSDPSRALHGPAAVEVAVMTGALGDADRETRIPTLDDVTAERFLEAAAGDIRSVWPDLARRLDGARDSLG